MTETPVTEASEQITRQPLTAHDRCDTRACDAQAYVRVHITPLLELLFCGHHWAEKRASIGAVINVQDDTGTITKARDKR